MAEALGVSLILEDPLEQSSPRGRVRLGWDAEVLDGIVDVVGSRAVMLGELAA